MRFRSCHCLRSTTVGLWVAIPRWNSHQADAGLMSSMHELAREDDVTCCCEIIDLAPPVHDCIWAGAFSLILPADPPGLRVDFLPVLRTFLISDLILLALRARVEVYLPPLPASLASARLIAFGGGRRIYPKIMFFQDTFLHTIFFKLSVNL